MLLEVLSRGEGNTVNITLFSVHTKLFQLVFVRYICVFQSEKAKISKIPTSLREVRNLLFVLLPGEIKRSVAGVAKYKNPLLMHAMSSLGMPDQFKKMATPNTCRHVPVDTTSIPSYLNSSKILPDRNSFYDPICCFQGSMV